ncbi:ubiquitin-like domain-containing CTD phosphatase 1 [Tubulanus polymorphus]|uniref:ubiquitin-like domain-containing CTD phosphatase 1 n=1 Tax=Tubulanus polymorphus TaxID=672921 RepID=UPI003DA1D10B
MANDGFIDFIVKWSGKEYKIEGLSESETVYNLKDAIKKQTGVMPERMKLMGLKYKGKPPDDDVSLGLMKLKATTRVMMMGTREDDLVDMEPPKDLPEVVNDFDIEEEEIAIEDREEFLSKIEKRVRDYKIDMINEPRPGKKLLVLDIDYTLFDHRSVGETGNDLMRPFLHEFLTSAYEDYDIVIWSATGMKWIEAKMNELGVSANPNYKLTFMLDSTAMITVHSPKYGVIDVKPLGVIWGKFSCYTCNNTVMFDDMRRNFIMNPKNGLKIRPFKKAHFNRDKDRELIKLAKYLKDISQEEDFMKLNHKHWERYRPPSEKNKNLSRSRTEEP